ncbi:hypothetical protein [Streptomyces murinus]|uniref:hypothetical protein n=1 Tax=Streptomyces murinus TaxID=33900 RepID=UPI002114C2B7|nr:hypothetical protein [Streptomyces murinus]
MRPRPLWLLGCALAPALVLTACTSHNGPAPSHSPSSPAAHQSGGAQNEKKLAEQAQAARDSAVAQGGPMVEAGVERASDGVHTRSDLAHGVAYKLTVVCAGKGAAEIVVAPSGAGGRQAVPCDTSVVSERLTGKGTLRLDIEAKPGTTAMIAWRIDKAGS